MLSCKQSSHFVWALLAGMLGAIGALFRPDLLLLFFWGGAWLMLFMPSLRHKLISTSVFAIFFVLPLLPWGFYNLHHHDVFTVSTTGSGVGLWEGLGVVANPYGYVLDDQYTGKMLLEKGMKWHSLEANQYLTAEYMKALREHPGHVLRCILVRWQEIVQAPVINLGKPFVNLDKKWFYIPFLLGYAFSCLWLLRQRKWDIFCLTNFPLLYALFSVGLIHSEPRYVRYVLISYILGYIFLVRNVLAARESKQTRSVPHSEEVLPKIRTGVIATVESKESTNEQA
jgi:hypothetical protein